MKCSRCGVEISGDEVFSYQGQTLCEDDYIDAISPERKCDPWATYVSTRETGSSVGVKSTAGLTETQQVIFEFVKKQGKATKEEVMAETGLSNRDLAPHLNVLMHAELVKERNEAGTIYLIPIPVSRE